MTPELKAAMERMRKYHDTASGLVIYPADVEASVAADLELLARAFVAEHAYDDRPVAKSEVEAATGYSAFMPVWINTIKTRRKLRALLEVLGVEHG